MQLATLLARSQCLPLGPYHITPSHIINFNDDHNLEDALNALLPLLASDDDDPAAAMPDQDALAQQQAAAAAAAAANAAAAAAAANANVVQPAPPPPAAPAPPPAFQLPAQVPGVINVPTQEWALSLPMKFFGLPTPKNTLSPQAFLRELESRRTKHHWPDRHLLPYAQSCLYGEADSWFKGHVMPRADGTPLSPTENFDVFRKLFEQHYYLGGKTFTPNWDHVLHQQANEGSAAYLSRSFAALHHIIVDHTTKMLGRPRLPQFLPRLTAAATNFTQQHFQDQASFDANMPLLLQQLSQEATDATQLALLNAVPDHANAAFKFWAEQLLFQGLSNKDQRDQAKRLLAEGNTMYDVADMVNALRKQPTGHVAPAAPQEEIDLFGHHVDAYAPSNPNQGKKNQKKKKTGPKTPQHKECSFCNRRGHYQDACPLKQKAALLAVAEHNKDISTPATTPSAPALMSLALPSPPPQGNGLGWH